MWKCLNTIKIVTIEECYCAFSWMKNWKEVNGHYHFCRLFHFLKETKQDQKSNIWQKIILSFSRCLTDIMGNFIFHSALSFSCSEDALNAISKNVMYSLLTNYQINNL